jgi:hypothetical protein
MNLKKYVVCGVSQSVIQSVSNSVGQSFSRSVSVAESYEVITKNQLRTFQPWSSASCPGPFVFQCLHHASQPPILWLMPIMVMVMVMVMSIQRDAAPWQALPGTTRSELRVLKVAAAYWIVSATTSWCYVRLYAILQIQYY